MKEGHLVSKGSVSELMHTSSKQVTAVIDGHKKNFLYTGDMNSLIRELAGKDVTELDITDPSIEEIFMGYYSEEKNVPGGEKK